MLIKRDLKRKALAIKAQKIKNKELVKKVIKEPRQVAKRIDSVVEAIRNGALEGGITLIDNSGLQVRKPKNSTTS